MSAGGHPVSTTQVSVSIADTPTDIVISLYSDRIFILVTQLRKIGTLVAASQDLTELEHKPSYSIKTIMGARAVDGPDVAHVFARRLIESIGEKDKRPLLLGLGLKNSDPQTFRAVVATVLEHKTWK